MSAIRIGFIGFGEAAFGMMRGLRRDGLEVAAYDKFAFVEPRGTLIRRKAAEAGVALTTTLEELMHRAEYVLCAVSANAALPIASEVRPFLKAGHVYADINSTSPATKKKIHEVVAGTPAKFVEIAVMAPVASYGCTVPMLACGSGAKELSEAFTRIGMNVTYLGETVGKAAAIKMIRSICIKGLLALLVEALHAARKYDIVPEILTTVKKTLLEETSFEEMVNRFITSTAVHSERFGHEMEEVVETLQEVGADFTMTAAAVEKMRWCTMLGLKDHFGGARPPRYQDVLEAYETLKTR